MPLSISVIVCTRNRAERLMRCIAAFEAVKTTSEWELIVVDNGSTDDTEKILASLPKRIGNAEAVSVYEQRPRLTVAQNAGLKLAKGEIVAFTDDDCYVTENYIDSLKIAFSENPDVGFVSGRILLFDRTDISLTIKESETPGFYLPRSFISAGEVQGANMAFRREALEAVGGFDENLKSGGDVDVVASILQGGLAGVFDPRIVVYHHHGRKEKDAKALMRYYDLGRGAYYAKYLLDSRSRKTYIVGWCHAAASQIWAPWYSRPKAVALFFRTTGRECIGAVRYLKRRLARGSHKSGTS